MESRLPRQPRATRSIWAFVTLVLGPCAGAQDAPTPNARFAVGGQVSLSGAARDRGYFNNTVYDRSALRLLRLGLQGSLRMGGHLAFLTEIRKENLDAPSAYALYARIRPWRERPFDVQIGRIPPVFGAFPRRRYDVDNPLIGYPLAYQYLTTLRPDAAPGSADELLRIRGGGWLVRYGDGYGATARPGLPLANSFRWDTGVEARIGNRPFELSAALTRGSLGNPLLHDDNDGKQIAARLVFTPSPAWVAGASVARGAYLDRDTVSSLAYGVGSRDFLQRAYGLDLEYSRGYWVLRSEALLSEWDAPLGASPSALRALGVMAEARYRLRPGLSLAARWDHLGFSRLQGSASSDTWDAPVTRVETAVAYSPRRNTTIKVCYQHNWRDGGRVREQSFLAGQVLWWF